MSQDSKQQNKIYLEKYLNDANLTKDDDSTEFDYSIMYDSLPYSPVREFLPYDDYCLMYLLGDPESTPLLNYDHTPYGYEERQPITISCITKLGVTATKAKWKAEHELRRILETYPLGSIRSMNKRRDATVKIGSTVIYQTQFDINYRRSNESLTDITLTYGQYIKDPGVFTFPNCINLEFSCPPRNIAIPIPGRVTDVPQGLGAEDAVINMTCDLDIAPLSWNPPPLCNTNKWKRPQTGTPPWAPTDFVAGQIFMEMAQNEANGWEPSQTLNLGWLELEVVLVDKPRFYWDGERSLADLTFREYSETSKAGQDVVERFELT